MLVTRDNGIENRISENTNIITSFIYISHTHTHTTATY